ncbi:CoB--CoM heterodisulfide reductase subunit C [Methanobrevibacter filiformis]|uniref:Succinate dehydrogenase/fumarate reductase iron-sulfur subunit n=1 Tax=Methanobrevibacter filiformis TaxID=55758 RepID=A0A166A9P8_9EURY|nr:CoB--CoM heterodisulfide reductase subunit C [Methanobrevibacter filiformis]KZX11758.1 succinate dehydrogenase/fumarate reductase iron-sulfur subunit [Methanobrevibacter filiformis]
MSWFKRLKALFNGVKNDVNSDEGMVDNITKQNDVLSKKPTSSINITEEKKKSSVTNVSKTPELEKEPIESIIQSKVSTKDTEKLGDNSTNAEKKVEVIEEKVINDSNTNESSEEDVEENKKVSEEKSEKGDNMTLLKDDEVINLGKIDKEFTQLFVDAGIESLENCFQCGTCSGGCPSGRRTPYKVRQIVRKCLMGLKDDVISDPSLWMCTTCYTCQERCPREIKIVEIIKKARNIAAENGFMAPAHKATGANVIKTGHGVPINDATKALRKRVGLSELPPTTHADESALKDIQAICKATGFDTLIDYEE